MSGEEIGSLLLNTIGAVAVTGIFVWYLTRRDRRDQEESKQHDEQIKHLISAHQDQTTEQMSYLKGRDDQSRQIAESGHMALSEMAKEVAKLREEMARGEGR